MPIPRIVLISRKSLEHAEDALKQALGGVSVSMAVAVSPDDAVQAQKLTEAVAQFQHITAIVADFPFDMIVDEEGKCEVIGMVAPTEAVPSLITEV